MTKMRKLRTLKEILEMFPDHYFDAFGTLVCQKAGFCIPAHEFISLGSDQPSDKWDKRLYVEPETRKLYAHLDVTDEIRWAREDRTGGMWRHMKRVEGFDLTFGEQE